MSATRVPSIPAPTDDNLREVARAVKGILDVREGLLGDPLDKSVTFRDLVSGELVEAVVVSRGGGTGSITVRPAPGLVSTPEPDLTPPAAPTGLTATAGLAVIILEWATPTFSNYAYTEVWRASTNALGSAQRVGTTQASVYTDSLGATGVTRFYWVRHRSTEDVVGPFSATDGVSATTGKIGNTDLGPLVVEAANLANGAVTGGKLAVGAIAAGTAAIQNGAIINAMLGDATITSAKIASVSVDKLTAGAMQVGSYIESQSYTTSGGTQGWRINADGTATFNNVSARGNINATSGTIIGATIATASSGQRIVFDNRGLLFLTGASSGKYGTFKYGARKYGSGVLVFFNNADRRVPFYVSAEQNVADIHLYNRSANPTGATYEAGDMIVVNGRLRIFVPALGGWKQVALEP